MIQNLHWNICTIDELAIFNRTLTQTEIRYLSKEEVKKIKDTKDAIMRRIEIIGEAAHRA